MLAVVDRDDHLRRLWLLDPDSAKVRQITSGRWRINEAEWLPNGTTMIASATDHPNQIRRRIAFYSINLADGKLTEIAAPRGPFGRLRVSPDGKSVVYVAAPVDGPSTHDLFLLTLADGKMRNLTSAVAGSAGAWLFMDIEYQIGDATIQNGSKTILSQSVGGWNRRPRLHGRNPAPSTCLLPACSRSWRQLPRSRKNSG
jgi:tricorn protease-like protein